MRFVYGKQNMRTLERAQENNFLLTNALGGYASVTGGYGVPRCDQGLLVAAVKAPNVRINMVHRMKETLRIGDQELLLSTQEFADGRPPEEGYRNLASFVYDGLPTWTYDVSGVRVTRCCVMEQEKNTTVMVYTLENCSGKPVTLTLEPFFKMVPRENVLDYKKDFSYANGVLRDDQYTVYLKTDAVLEAKTPVWQWVAYPEDVKDGRPEKGMAFSCCQVSKMLLDGESAAFEVSFSLEDTAVSGKALMDAHYDRQQKLLDLAGLQDPLAQQLVLAADAYIARRDSTNGKTILAGYPLFWLYPVHRPL